MNPYYISYLPIVCFSLVYFLTILKIKESVSSPKFFLITFSYFFVSNIGNWASTHIELDAAQWYVCGKSLFDDFNYWKSHYALIDHGRFFCILLVGLLYKLNSNPDILFNILTFVSYMTLTMTSYYVLKRHVQKSVIFIGICLFSVNITAFNQISFWNFNSEHVVIIFYCLSLFFLSKGIWIEKRNSTAFFFSGFFLVCSTFSKEQFILCALGTFVLTSIYLVSIKKTRWFLFFSLGALFNVVFIILFCLKGFLWEDIFSLYKISFDYKNKTLTSQEETNLNIDAFVAFLKATGMNSYYVIFHLFVLYFLGKNLNYQKIKSSFSKPKFLIFLLLTFGFFITLLTILLSLKQPFHYTLLLFPFFLCLLIIGISYVNNKHSKLIFVIIFCYTTISPFVTKKTTAIFPINGYNTLEKHLNHFSSFRSLKKIIPPNEKVMFWGWANQFYLGLKSKRASSFLYPQFAMKKMSSHTFVGNIYLSDLKNAQPTYFVELVGPSHFFTNDTSIHSVKNNQIECYLFLKEHYEKIFDSTDVVVYKKREL